MQNIARDISSNVTRFWKLISFTLLDRVVPNPTAEFTAFPREEQEEDPTDSEVDKTSEAEQLSLHTEMPLPKLKRWYSTPILLDEKSIEPFRGRTQLPEVEEREGLKRKAPSAELKCKKRGRGKRRRIGSSRRTTKQSPPEVEIPPDSPQEPATSPSPGRVEITCALTDGQLREIQKIEAGYYSYGDASNEYWDKRRGRREGEGDRGKREEGEEAKKEEGRWKGEGRRGGGKMG
jgi:hypothetical protein